MPFSDAKIPSLSETSDYGSGTDLEFQSIQNITPPTDSSAFTFDLAETTNHTSQPRRISLSSSSSSSSSSRSPSSSMSNLSSLSSSSEHPMNFNRLSNKKLLSINNNNNIPSNEPSLCQCDKENLSNRKRNRYNSYPIRRLTTVNYCENCQIKRTKCNYRSKCSSNRPQKQRQNNQAILPTKFYVDLTGLNIDYTVEYHENLKCICSPGHLAYYNSPPNRCKCLSINDWPMFFMMNSVSEYNHDVYYLDSNSNSWFPPAVNSALFTYNDFYLTKADHHRNSNLSSIYFDDPTILEATEPFPPYYLRCMTPAIEFECEEINNTTNSCRSLLPFTNENEMEKRMSNSFLSFSRPITTNSIVASSSLAEHHAANSNVYSDELQYTL